MKEITISAGPGDCEYVFERGVEYIVYASVFKRFGDLLFASRCSRTRPVDSAAEDLEYFRQLPQSKPLGEIRIIAFDPEQNRARWPPVDGLAGLRLTIRGQHFYKTATTDQNGRHAFAELPPGEYQVAAVLTGYKLVMPLSPIKVHGAGCAEVLVRMAPAPH